MVTNVAFLGKPIDPFQKWTKKMSKIENPKILLGKNHEKLTNNIINSQNNLKKIKRSVSLSCFIYIINS
jgi:hypothetical protein